MYGKTLNLRGIDYVVPPASAADLITYESQVNQVLSIASFPKAEEWTAIGDLLYAALRCNYPEMTREQVGKLLDTGNFEMVIRVVLFGFMALREKPEGAGKGEGARPNG